MEADRKGTSFAKDKLELASKRKNGDLGIMEEWELKEVEPLPKRTYW
jgi:hypothetical protein